MAYQVVEGVLIAVHGKSAPSDDEWAAYMDYYRQNAMNCFRTLAVTDGGGPDAKQRAMTVEYTKGKPLNVAVCTDNTLVKGIVTALSWFNPRMKVFSKAQLRDALDYLRVAPIAAQKIIVEVEKMKATITK